MAGFMRRGVLAAAVLAVCGVGRACPAGFIIVPPEPLTLPRDTITFDLTFIFENTGPNTLRLDTFGGVGIGRVSGPHGVFLEVVSFPPLPPQIDPASSINFTLPMAVSIFPVSDRPPEDLVNFVETDAFYVDVVTNQRLLGQGSTLVTLQGVPEPASLVLLGLGLVGAVGVAQLTQARREGDRAD